MSRSGYKFWPTKSSNPKESLNFQKELLIEDSPKNLHPSTVQINIRRRTKNLYQKVELFFTVLAVLWLKKALIKMRQTSARVILKLCMCWSKPVPHLQFLNLELLRNKSPFVMYVLEASVPLEKNKQRICVCSCFVALSKVPSY